MITAFYGEFTVSPIPLEMSFGSCSHGCSYCFANLNTPNRQYCQGDLHLFMRDLEEDTSLEAELVKAGYPVTLSNRSDPFCTRNYRDTLDAIELLTKHGVGLSFQTKGGLGIDDALKMVRPSVWYVTIETDDKTRQRIAPAAPAIQARLALVEKLASKGHAVVIGVNPCVDAWLPDPMPLLAECTRRGACGAWIERLHLSKTQASKLSPKARWALDKGIVKRARSAGDPVEVAHIERVRAAALDAGLEVFSVGQPNKSAFFEPYQRLYRRLYPTLQDYVNRLHDSHIPGDLLSFDNYAAFMCGRLPYGELELQSYFGATDRGIFSRYTLPRRMTYRDMLWYTWVDPYTKFSLVHSPAFAYAGMDDEDGWVQVVDENKNPFLLFSPSGFDGYYSQQVN